MSNGCPIVICGAGYIAQITWEFMQKRGLSADYVAVDEQYLTQDIHFYGLPVTSFETLTHSGKQYNYIIAMQHFSDVLREKLAQSSREMLFYDCAFIGVNSPEIFTYEWCKANDAVLNDFYTSLEDVRSQETLLAYLNQRICAREGYYAQQLHTQHYFPQELIHWVRMKFSSIVVLLMVTVLTDLCARWHAMTQDRLSAFLPSNQTLKPLHYCKRTRHHFLNACACQMVSGMKKLLCILTHQIRCHRRLMMSLVR